MWNSPTEADLRRILPQRSTCNTAYSELDSSSREHFAELQETQARPSPAFIINTKTSLTLLEAAIKHDLNTEQKLEIYTQIAEGCKYLHERGFLVCSLLARHIFVTIEHGKRIQVHLLHSVVFIKVWLASGITFNILLPGSTGQSQPFSAIARNQQEQTSK